VAPAQMTDEGLDELILGRLRMRWEHAAHADIIFYQFRHGRNRHRRLRTGRISHW